MTKRQKKQLALLGAMALALIAIVVLSIVLISNGVRNGTYNKLYDSANESYMAQEYDEALKTAKKILALKKLSVEKQTEVYLLMADIYVAQGKPNAAQALLEDAYSVLKSEALNERLLALRAEQALELESGDIVIGSVTVARDAESAVLANMNLTSQDIAELSQATALQSLNLSGNQIDDVSALQSLTALTSLSIMDNKISDLTDISKLTGLKTLYLDNNPITDLTPLYGMPNLAVLSIRGIEITEEQLQTLCEKLPNCAVYCDIDSDSGDDEITIGGRTISVDVTELELISCGISDISELAKLTKLQYLNLQGNSISDLSPLSGLTNLTKLILWDNNITNIYPLASLTNLTYLDIDSNNIQDLTPLASLKNLNRLWCSGNNPSSLEPISSLSKLTHLGLKNDGLKDSDLEYIKKLTNLIDLRLDGNTSLTSKAIASLQSALPSCAISKPSGLTDSITLGGTTYYTDATSISCSGAGVSDISGLSAFKNLTSLTLSNNSISDISALSGLTGLTSLDLSYNSGITSLSALSNLKSLTSLSLAGCSGVTSATDLYGLSNLWTLDVTGTGLTWEQVDMLRASLPNCAVFSDTTEPVETVEGDIGAENGENTGSEAEIQPGEELLG